jgi:hypothetical protein
MPEEELKQETPVPRLETSPQPETNPIQTESQNKAEPPRTEPPIEEGTAIPEVPAL